MHLVRLVPDPARQAPLDVIDGLDVPVALGMLLWVLAKLDAEGVAVRLELPTDVGWVALDAPGPALSAEVTHAHDAWIVQRPGCAGLVTRVVLRDAAGAALGALAAARRPGQPEPTAWRVLLLLALFGSEQDDRTANPDLANAAK